MCVAPDSRKYIFSPQLAGNAAGIIISTTICSVTSYIWPANYDFDVSSSSSALNGAAS